MTPMELFLHAVAVACGLLVIGAALLILFLVFLAVVGAIKE